VVTHSTNVVEYPELVTDRIVRFAEPVGRENVVTSTDCGLDGRSGTRAATVRSG
jgi:5-methyltetrahydropteroyltriglutamate--homocysteine methyltransferase